MGETKSIMSAVEMMTERKDSAGYLDNAGIVDDDQIRRVYIGLDLDADDVYNTAEGLADSMLNHMAFLLANGYPPEKYLQGVWADAFSIGVMYERQRNGQG